MKTHVSGSIAILEGPKFDFRRVVAAHESVLDTILENSGPVKIAVDMSKGRNRIDWPVPGKRIAMQLWDGLKNLHDADSRSLIVLGQDITVQVRLLGITWVIQDAETGALKLHDGSDVARINPAPVISVLGPWDEARQVFRLLSGARVDRIADLCNGPLAHLGLKFERLSVSTHQTRKSDLTDYVRIHFPHDSRYGAGRGLITVRCVSSDGREPDPTSVEN